MHMLSVTLSIRVLSALGVVTHLPRRSEIEEGGGKEGRRRRREGGGGGKEEERS